MYRVSVAEAVHRLGVSQDAVYKRKKQGTIPWEKGAGDKAYVWIEEADASTDSLRTSTYTATYRLIDELRDRIRFLETELADRKEEARRMDAILMTMAQRIPELEAPPEASGSPETASKGAGRGVAAPEPQEGSQRRSWWRTFFGLE